MRVLFNIAGIVALGLGLVGIFLPLLPTTPFVLLAAACFARGSERFHQWLLANRTFGPMVYEWERHRSLPYRTKVTAIVLMSLRDLLGPPLTPTPSLSGALAGLVPIAFPAMFTPALVLLSIAAAHERGVPVALAALVPAIAVAATTTALGRSGPSWTLPASAVAAGGSG